MARFDRLLKAMAPKVVLPEGAAPRPVARRGKRKPAHTRWSAFLHKHCARPPALQFRWQCA